MDVRNSCSIVLATLNGSKHLVEQLESYASQTHMPFELIASDDGSTDGTLEILRDFASSAPFPVIIVDGPRSGYGENFASAARLASGNVILFSDQDDVWLDEKISVMLEAHRSSGAATVIHDLFLMDEEGNSLGETFLDRLSRFGYTQKDHVKGCATSIHRSLVPTLSLRPTYIAHDHWVNLLGRKLSSLKVLNQSLAYYRLHESSTSTWWMNDPIPAGNHRLSTKRLRNPYLVSRERIKRFSRSRQEARAINAAQNLLGPENLAF